MNKKALLTLLLCTQLYPNDQLDMQKQKDYQAYRLAIIKATTTVSIVIIGAVVKVYLFRSQ